MELVHDEEEEGYLGKLKRTIWLCLILFTWFACATALWIVYFELEMPIRHVKLVLYSFGCSTTLYVLFLIVIEPCRKNKPLKLKPWFKVLVDYALVLCFGFAYFYTARNHSDDSLLIMLASVIGIATHLHIISVFNLLGAYENFGFSDCSLAVLLHAASFLSCKYSEYDYAPLAVMLVAFALQPMKKSSSPDDQDLQYYKKHKYYLCDHDHLV